MKAQSNRDHYDTNSILRVDHDHFVHPWTDFAFFLTRMAACLFQKRKARTDRSGRQTLSRWYRRLVVCFNANYPH